MINDNNFGNTLRQLRINKDLSQRELAKHLKIAPSTLAMYELNKREPGYETLKRIADFFEVSTDYLLGRSVEAHPLDKIVKEITGYDIKCLPKEAKNTLTDFIGYIHFKYTRMEKLK